MELSVSCNPPFGGLLFRLERFLAYSELRLKSLSTRSLELFYLYSLALVMNRQVLPAYSSHLKSDSVQSCVGGYGRVYSFNPRALQQRPITSGLSNLPAKAAGAKTWSETSHLQLSTSIQRQLRHQLPQLPSISRSITPGIGSSPQQPRWVVSSISVCPSPCAIDRVRRY